MKSYQSPSQFNSFEDFSESHLSHSSVSSQHNRRATRHITTIATAIQSVWQNFVGYLMGQSEPQITWRRDRQGYSYYEVYDPQTGQRYHCSSHQEVRVWLEQRYHR